MGLVAGAWWPSVSVWGQSGISVAGRIKVLLLVVSDPQTGGSPCPVPSPGGWLVPPAGMLQLAGWAGGCTCRDPRSQPRRHLCRRMSVCSGRMHAKIRHFFFLFCLRIPQKANIHER